MRVWLRVTDDDGNISEGEVKLARAGEARSGQPSRSARAGADVAVTRPDAIDLSLPVRAFVNRYARGRSGARSFALLVARLAEGQVGREVTADALQAEWRRVKGIIGTDYAPVHGTRARDRAWVDSPRRGVFTLLPGWEGALGDAP